MARISGPATFNKAHIQYQQRVHKAVHFVELFFWHCLETYKTQSVQAEGYVSGTFNLANNLREELASLPKNVSLENTTASICTITTIKHGAHA